MSDPAGEVITFYSYKGGTGRTMALANVACLLAQTQTLGSDRRRVLAIDWDVEAPGLHRYFEPLLPDLDASKLDARPGLIDLFEELDRRLPKGLSGEEEERHTRTVVDAIDFAPFIIDTAYLSLSLMKAGRFDEHYPRRTNTFDWDDLFGRAPSLFRLFAERLQRDYSYTLIDARTGVTDTSGICTSLLPDKLVVVFTPNRQSLTGIVDLIDRATKNRKSSGDLRPVIIYPLPSRIEMSVTDKMKTWRFGDGESRGWEAEFTEALRKAYNLGSDLSLAEYFDTVQVQHVAPYAYGEPIAVLEERGTDRLTLTYSYARFRDYLVQSAPWTATLEAPRLAEAEFERVNEALRELHVKTQVAHGEERASNARLALIVVMGVFILGLIGWLIWGSSSLNHDRTDGAIISSVLTDADTLPPTTVALVLSSLLHDANETNKALILSTLKEHVPRMARPLPPIRTTRDPSSVAFGPSDNFLVYVVDGEVHIVSIHEQQADEIDVVAGLAATPNDVGVVIVRADGGVVLRLGKNSEEPLAKLPRSNGYQLGTKGRFVVESSAGTASVYSLPREGRPNGPVAINALTYHLRGAPGFAFSPNGRLGGVWDDEEVYLFDQDQFQGQFQAQPVPRRLSEVRGLALGDDSGGRNIAVATANGIHLSLRRGETVVPVLARAVAMSDHYVAAVQESPTSSILRVDMATGEQTTLASDGTVRRVAFLPNGDLARISRDRIEIAPPTVSTPLALESRGDLSLVTFSDRGTFAAAAFAAGSSNYGITIWSLERTALDTKDENTIISDICNRVGRDLTADEKSRYFVNREYKSPCTQK